MDDLRGFLVFILVLVASGAVVTGIDALTRHRRFPNWFTAARTFPAPPKTRTKPRWRLCYYRDAPGHRLVERQIAVAPDGLLVRDCSSFVFPKLRTILVPWTSLSNPKEVTLPFSVGFLWRRCIQLEVKGTNMIILVRKAIWFDIQRNLAAGVGRDSGRDV